MHCRSLQRMGEFLDLSHTAIAAACHYFQIFYARNELKSQTEYVLMACLLVAAKLDEKKTLKAKELREDIRAAYMKAEGKLGSKKEFNHEELHAKEMQILIAAEFNFEFPRYHTIMVHAFFAIFRDYCASTQSIEKMMNEPGGLGEMTWHLINDSLQTTLCLQYEQELITIAALHLTFKTKGIFIVRKSDKYPKLFSNEQWRKVWNGPTQHGAPNRSTTIEHISTNREEPTDVWYEDLFSMQKGAIEDACDQLLLLIANSRDGP